MGRRGFDPPESKSLGLGVETDPPRGLKISEQRLLYFAYHSLCLGDQVRRQRRITHIAGHHLTILQGPVKEMSQRMVSFGGNHRNREIKPGEAADRVGILTRAVGNRYSEICRRSTLLRQRRQPRCWRR